MPNVRTAVEVLDQDARGAHVPDQGGDAGMADHASGTAGPPERGKAGAGTPRPVPGGERAPEAEVERRRADDLSLELARTRGEFIALAGHALRTPLTTIVSLTDLLLTAGDELAGEREDLLRRIKANADTLRGIVEDLLVLGGLESGHINLNQGPLDLSRLVADAVAEVAPEGATARVVIETDLPPELPAYGDHTRLRQAVDNLLSNAVKYSPDGGRVRVRLTAAGGFAELIVADQGLGIPEAERDRLFSRFFRGATAHERGIPGTGLGLPLTRLIAELHGGTIALTDRGGDAGSDGDPADRRGTTFTLRLPLPAGSA